MYLAIATETMRSINSVGSFLPASGDRMAEVLYTVVSNRQACAPESLL